MLAAGHLPLPFDPTFFLLFLFALGFFPLSSFLGLSLFHLKMTDGSFPRCSCDFFFQLFIVVFSRSSCREPGTVGARLQPSRHLHLNNSLWMLWVTSVLQALPLHSSLVHTRLQLMWVSAVPSLVEALLFEAGVSDWSVQGPCGGGRPAIGDGAPQEMLLLAQKREAGT